MEIYKKLFNAKKEIGKISKDSTNPFYKSKYFDINSLLEHVEPILQKHGLLLLQPIRDGKVCTEIYDIDEDVKFLQSCLELTNQTDPQKRGSEITYYRRYTLQSLLGLQAEDDDANMTVKKPQQDDGKQQGWLNKSNKAGLLTKEWNNVLGGIKSGSITKLSQVTDVYKVNKELRAELNELLTDEIPY